VVLAFVTAVGCGDPMDESLRAGEAPADAEDADGGVSLGDAGDDGDDGRTAGPSAWPPEAPEPRPPASADAGSVASPNPPPAPPAGEPPEGPEEGPPGASPPGEPPPPPSPPPPEPLPSPQAGPEAVFGLDVLHRVELVVDPQHLPTLNSNSRRLVRVPATLRYDGVELTNVALRRKGGIGSRRDLYEKTGFSIDMNDFVPGQRLHGLKKLVLNNSVQDPSFLNEHLGYQIARRAGLPASLTAHAVVTFNGRVFGLYVVKESVDTKFLARHFGKDNDHGNLYEGPCCGDLVPDASRLELKREESEQRSREDVDVLSMLLRATPDAQWIDAVGARLDLDQFIAHFAVDALANHFDGYGFARNNFYIYNHPGRGRFVFIHHGMDQLFRYADPLRMPVGIIARKVRELPALDARFMDALESILDQAWDVPALEARIDRAARVITSHVPADAQTAADLQSFRANVQRTKDALAQRKRWLESLRAR
jgi:hypothetical protein